MNFIKDSIFGRPDEPEKLKKKIPGPGVPILGDLPTATKWTLANPGKLPMHRTLELHGQFGPVYSFGVGSATFVIVGDPAMFRQVLTHEDFQEHINLPFLKTFGARKGIFMADYERWKVHRRFSHRILRDLGFGKIQMQDNILREATHLVDDLRSRCSEPVETRAAMSCAVSNVINQLVFGKRFDYSEPEFARQLDSARMVTNISLTLVFFPMMFPWLEGHPDVMKALPGSASFAEGYAFIKAFCKREIAWHKEKLDFNNNEADQPEDFITAFLREQVHQDPESEHYFTDDDLCDIVADFFVAGTDTTAVALTWAALLLAKHQDVQDQVRAELFYLGDTILEKQAGLHYTRAFWDEVLRFCMLVPLNMRHSVRETSVGGYRIPADTVVGANAYAVSRNAELFPEPEAFRPARFLDAEGCYCRSPAMDGLVFGAGKRGCMGESLARMEMLVFLASLVQNFQLELPEKERPRFSEIFIGEDGAVHQPKQHRILFTELHRD
uniref:Cytochrome P450 n=1 Tax=Macrostomum lignano TaxID=282301 RepID=A0A1I8I3R8_9PLAT